MSNLLDIIEAIQKKVEQKSAYCLILSSDDVSESSLLGIKDGYLNLAVALLQLVAASENDMIKLQNLERLSEEGAYWDDSIKQKIKHLPGSNLYIVGSYLFDNHEKLIKFAEEILIPITGEENKLSNDPSFQNPS